MTLINVFLDEALDVDLMIRTDQDKANVIDMECQEKTLCAGGSDSPSVRFKIPVIPPWQMRLVICAN